MDTLEKLFGMDSPFEAACDQLYAKGYQAIPLEPKSKAVQLRSWADYSKKPIDQETIKTWKQSPREHNIGIVLGQQSNIVGLDFDYDIDNMHEAIKKIAGVSPVGKIGSKGITLFYRYNGERSKSWKLDGEAVVELLSDGKQTVVPPSVHPDTDQPYTWEGSSLLDTESHSLPYLPDDFIDQVDQLFKKDTPAKEDICIDDKAFEIAQVKEALEYIDAEAYDDWIKIGMALKHAFEDEGLALFHEWSSKAPNYNAMEIEKKWESYDGDGVTLGTLYHMAYENGYTKPHSSPQGSVSVIDPMKILATLEDQKVNGRPIGVSFGFDPIDRFMKFRPDELTIVTGTAGSGKSTFIDFLLYNLMRRHGFKTRFVSFETPADMHLNTFIQRKTGKTFEERSLEETKSTASSMLKYISYYDFHNSTSDIDCIIEDAKKERLNGNLDVLVVDPYAYLSSKYHGDEFSHAQHVVKSLKSLAKDYKMHVFLVAHPKTPREGAKKVDLYSISGGATFYNLADNGMVVSRDADNDTVEVWLQKVKRQDENNKPGSFECTFDTQTQTYMERKRQDFS